MHILEFTCDGFRSLAQVELRPGPRINVIRGRNAQGKTTLLEALLYAATSKSHRTNNEQELVQHGKQGFHIQALVQRHDRQVVLDAIWWQGAKRFKVNGVAQTRVSDILGKVNLVFFSPEDVDLVRGSAAARRKFLDMELSQLSPHYLNALQQYRQVLRQRNEVLKQHVKDTALLEAWDAQLVQHGRLLMVERTGFISELAGHARTAYDRIAGDEQLSLRYDPDIREASDYAKVLRAACDVDRRQGLTTRGPHRDDVHFEVQERAARQFASQGQQRTAALALKLAELELVRSRTGEYPIFMLDDVLSELDATRARQFFDAIPEGVQCLLTTTEQETERALFGPDSTYFCMKRGHLEAETPAEFSG